MIKTAKVALSLFIFSLLASGCKQTETAQYYDGSLLIQSKANSFQSSSAGNLMATAIKEAHELDVVFYPATFLSDKRRSILTAEAGKQEVLQNELAALYPSQTELRDQFQLGTMSGEDIKTFLLQRSREYFGLELEVAGLEYHIHFVGGVPTLQTFSRKNNYPLEDERYYRVAISEFYFFNGNTFPGYKYRNSLNFSFTPQDKKISAQKALKTYLEQRSEYPYFGEVRAKVTKSKTGVAGDLSINQIQGAQHLSPHYGKTVTTRGVITAMGSVEWYPGGIDVYIESPFPDSDVATSEGLKLYFDRGSVPYKIGDYIEVSGTVYEEITTTGLGSTSLREITSHRKLDESVSLPEPVRLGLGGREIPSRYISTYRGNLNSKNYLKLEDGIDFWESLEGMRVKVNNPRILGFRGGLEELESSKPKGYLNIFIKADGDVAGEQDTPAGGVIVSEAKVNFNPNVMQIISNHLSSPIDTSKVFNVGEKIQGEIEGVITYEKNLFGDGEYAMVLPHPQRPLIEFLEGKNGTVVPLVPDPQAPEKPIRPHTRLASEKPSQLTVAVYNLENLAGYQDERIKMTALAISESLRCPNIVSLVEIQDENGQDFEGGASAEVTLDKLIRNIKCKGSSYVALNIDPVLNAEGGQPGGNIRIAMIYDSSKVNFTPRTDSNPIQEVRVRDDGSLSSNPGRIFPDDRAFKNSRRTIVAEFEFKGEKVFVLGNHFNSKIGDSRWTAIQPAGITSENKRTKMAGRIKYFVEILKLKAPDAHVIVTGDFNALIDESSLNVVESAGLKNLTSLLLPENEWYTTNYNGSSQALDHIFASHSLLGKSPEVEILHINSDFMGRLSDHDPVVARFEF